MAIQLYVRILNEGTQVWRPVIAEQCGKNEYVIRGAESDDIEGEEWEFRIGEIVQCQVRVLSGIETMVAIRKAR